MFNNNIEFQVPILQLNSGYFLLKKGRKKYLIKIALDGHEPSATLFVNDIYSDLAKQEKIYDTKLKEDVVNFTSLYFSRQGYIIIKAN